MEIIPYDEIFEQARYYYTNPAVTLMIRVIGLETYAENSCKIGYRCLNRNVLIGYPFDLLSNLTSVDGTEMSRIMLAYAILRAGGDIVDVRYAGDTPYLEIHGKDTTRIVYVIRKGRMSQNIRGVVCNTRGLDNILYTEYNSDIIRSIDDLLYDYRQYMDAIKQMMKPGADITKISERIDIRDRKRIVNSVLYVRTTCAYDIVTETYPLCPNGGDRSL